ncbi:His-Xaa-Ser system protein HxsD [Persicobacter diffluens]|uniref:His-Xaa-Ser system protein HxsD n=1 Tax=Persicobacter diffluens TaxID=981 RepID=A0AAN5ANM4_9BACT|nr:hypothetical protein PEDI_54990 [Persicobacter diffluens]
MMVKINRISETKLAVTVSDNEYKEAVVLKCFYWYSKECVVDFSKKEGEQYEVVLTKKEGEISDGLFAYLSNKIKQDLYDYKLRDLVQDETSLIRELLIAKAFANSDDFDNPPPGEVSDPVGYTPKY